MRGEKSAIVMSDTLCVGSSPHARGKVLNSQIFIHGHRIIPACAGKRRHQFIIVGEDQDHPRMRGEKHKVVINREIAIGSSPHARGKANEENHKLWEFRIIPACAGKRQCEVVIRDKYKDHPRMRGEKESQESIAKMILGSSPHARGKVCNKIIPSKLNRIIPACAGKSISHPVRR